jgi:DNA polymerase elongation subunit (family B)
VNYFLVLFKSDEGTVFTVKMHNDVITGNVKAIESILRKNPLISFNGDNYDMVILSAFLQGYSNAKLKELSDAIIVDGIPKWKLHDRYPDLRIKSARMGHIDLVGPTPLQASLKAYGCRIHSEKLQDLPIEPYAVIDDEQAAVLEAYCENDVDVTWRIYKEMLPQLTLRAEMTKTYGIDMTSKSDPQIAEAIIKHRMEEKGLPVNKRDTEVLPFRYNVPDFIQFDTPTLRDVLDKVRNAEFKVKETGNVILPEEISQVIHFDNAKYKLGIGGLHSQEKKQVIEPNAGFVLGEYDVASMYPSIIIGQNLYPEHLGKEFIDIYKEIFDERIEAKHSGNKTVADTLKIVLNSSYGKFGSKYSFLYSPELLIQTTLSGQLALLMLIERVSANGAVVVSANTDGINVLMHRDNKPIIDGICEQWSKETTYVLEWTEYKATYSESVNSYVALKPDGGAKTKGLYESGSIRKGYSAQVCNDAVVDYLVTGSEVAMSIYAEQDIRQFLVMRGVRGGAIWNGEEIGKVVRWYFSTEGQPITYKNNGNKVAGSDGAKPMMDLVEGIPDDLDYEKYIEIAEKKIERLGL